jgi:serine/threonine-protein kinase
MSAVLSQPRSTILIARDLPLAGTPARIGRYLLLGRIGTGGMAEIHEARLEGARGFAKRLAVKTLLPHCRREPQIVSGFVAEAQIASSLSHPNIVAVYDFGESEGIHYMVMELVDGWDIHELLRRCRAAGARIPVPAAAYVVRELAEALHYIHRSEHGIVHRDVSPHNVFLTRKGHVKLGDFGVAKSAAALSRTDAGQIKGKLCYLSPEQVNGDAVSERTDVYAAGLVLFELLTGRRLIEGNGEADLLRRAADPPPLLPADLVPEALPLAAALRGALAPHPAMRTRDAARLSAQLAEYLADHRFGPEEAAAFARRLAAPGSAADARPATPRPLVARSLATKQLAQPTAARRQVRTRRTLRLPSASCAAASLRRATLALRAVALGLVLPLFVVDGQSAAPTAERRAATAASARAAAPAEAQPQHLFAIDEGQRMSTVPDRPPRARPRYRAVSRVTPALERVEAAPPAAPRDDEHAARQRAPRELERIVAQAASRGLALGDDAAFDRRVARLRAAIARGDAVVVELRQLERHVLSFRVGEELVRAKLRRLERAMAATTEGQRRARSLAVQRVLRLVLDNRFAEASRQISLLLAARQPAQ